MTNLLNSNVVAQVKILANGCLLIVPAHLATDDTPAIITPPTTPAPQTIAPVKVDPPVVTPPAPKGRRKATPPAAPAATPAPAANQVTAPPATVKTCKHLMPADQCFTCTPAVKPAPTVTTAPPPPATSSKPAGFKGRRKSKKRDDSGDPIEVKLTDCYGVGWYKGKSDWITVAAWKPAPRKDGQKPDRWLVLFFKEGEDTAKHDDGGFPADPAKLANFTVLKTLPADAPALPQ